MPKVSLSTVRAANWRRVWPTSPCCVRPWLVRHRPAEVGTDPEGKFAGEVGQIGGQAGRLADQFPRQLHHVAQGLGHIHGECGQLVMAVAHLILDPAHHRHPERGVPHDVEHPEALLAQGHDVAAVVFLGLGVENFGTTTHFGHPVFLGIPAHHPEATVFGHHGAQHHPVAGLEDVQGQHLLGEEHHIGQGKQGEFPDGEFTHVQPPGRWRFRSAVPEALQQGAWPGSAMNRSRV